MQPGADGGECLTHHWTRVTAMVQRITRAPQPRLTKLRPLAACLPFALRALHLGLFGLCGRSVRLISLSLGVRAPGFAFCSSGLPRFRGLWFCEWLSNAFDFDGLGRRGQDRQRLGPHLRRVFAPGGCALLAKTGSGRQRRYNAAGSPSSFQASAASSSSLSLSAISPAMIASAISPAFWRTAASILLAMSGFSLRNCLAFSRPWPMRWLS